MKQSAVGTHRFLLPVENSARRNIFLLASGQALLITSTSLILTASTIVGQTLASNKALATLPYALLFFTLMSTTLPASMYMGRVGRRKGFMTGAFFGLAGAGMTTLAIYRGSFSMFCMGTVLIGVFNAFGQYVRFAAVEAVPENFKSRAISYVLAGGVIAAFLGPNLAHWSRQLLPLEFAGSFAGLAVLYLFAFSIAAFIKLPLPKISVNMPESRPFREVARQKDYIIAAISAMVGYGIMNFLMIATPLAMQANSLSFGKTALVIQWHIVGMFAPSFFTGNLIRRYGEANVMLTGIALLALCVGVNLAGTTLFHFWAGLFALGLGWNFVFIGATTLLTQTYSVSERAMAQGANDFIVFGTVTLTALSSGIVQHNMGWRAVNLITIPFILVIFAANLWQRYGVVHHHNTPVLD